MLADVKLRRPRRLAALQIEVTSRCHQRCQICPRTPLEGDWRAGDLSADVWNVLRADLKMADHVHLQGWGEPLLHPQLDQMVRDAHRAGCTVGVTSGGYGVRDAADWILDARLERVTVSVAGAGSWHAALRDGSDIEETWDAIRCLAERRRSRRRPRLQVSFLATTLNLQDLPEVVDAAACAGADVLYVTHLDCVASKTHRDLAVWASPGACAELAAVDIQVRRRARTTGMTYRAARVEPEERLICDLDPRRFTFVGWDGRVGPCVNLCLPVRGEVPRWSPEGRHAVEPTFFGTLHRQSLREILAGGQAAAFCQPFHARSRLQSVFLSGHWLSHGIGPPAIAELDRAFDGFEHELESRPFPDSCRACPKLEGW